MSKIHDKFNHTHTIKHTYYPTNNTYIQKISTAFILGRIYDWVDNINLPQLWICCFPSFFQIRSMTLKMQLARYLYGTSCSIRIEFQFDRCTSFLLMHCRFLTKIYNSKTHLSKLINFYSFWSHLKTFSFLMISGGIEVNQFSEIRLKLEVKSGNDALVHYSLETLPENL